ncbi:MAG: ABC transporter ATP-binding protein [Dehalococcoidia bacterium]|nr:ABC transporter ATP-binding protein [Dehalococcoidia bacterium]
MEEPLLRIEGLNAQFNTIDGAVRAVNNVSLSLRRGEILALTGESGAGKTSVGLSVLNLLPYPGRITAGRIIFNGTDLLSLPPEEMRRVRGREIAMVFQDPATGLNPVLSVGAQVEEIITAHLSVSKREARDRSLEALAQMGLPDPQEVARRYPFHLSGGMAQRVMIAIATALDPKVLIADEPTSALDVTVQAAILDDLRQLQRRSGTSILLITHDLGVVAQMADEVAVMYAGSIAESGDVRTVFERPRHPYTWALLRSRPRWDKEQTRPLPAIRGSPPNLAELSGECPYLPRCPKATTTCRTEAAPALAVLQPGHLAACYNPVQPEGDMGFD